MDQQGNEGSEPAAKQAAEEWRKRFGREGHEGSYAQHDEEEGAGAVTPPAEPSRTSSEG